MLYRSPYELATSTDLAPRRSQIFVDLEVKSIGENEHGLFARTAIREGTIIARDGGVVVTSIEDVVSDRNYVALIGEGLWLAPRDPDDIEPIFFLNHHCEPNVARLSGLVYIAKRDLAAGEELFVDYAPMISGYGDWEMSCRCGSQNCRKLITARDWESPAIARSLWSEWLPFVQKRILLESVLERDSLT